MRVLACGLLFLVIGGCSKSQPEPSESAATTESPKADAPSQVAVALAPSPGAPEAALPARTGAGPDCDKVCEPVRKLGCRRASECTDSCRQMADGPTCRSELLRFYACLASEPTEHWECMDDGTGAIKEGFCEREQSAFAACLEKSDVR